MHRFKLGILFAACWGMSVVCLAAKPSQVLPSKPAKSRVPIISSATALQDLMAAEFLANDRAFAAASRLYFPYAVNSPYVEVVERATMLAYLGGDLQQSTRLARQWLKIAPRDRTAYQILLTGQINAEQYDAARTTLERYLKHEQGSGADPVIPVLKALFQRLGETEAISQWECFIEYVEEPSARYRLQLALGALLLDGRDPKNVQKGMKALEDAMVLRPATLEPAVHYSLLMAKEEPEKAGKWLNEHVAKQPPNEANYLIVGFILSARQQLAFAQPVFEKAVQQYPKNTAFQVLYLQSLLENRSYTAAQKSLVHLLEQLDPKQPRTTQLAIQLMRLAQTPAEQEKAINFLKQVPETDEFYDAAQEILLYQLSELDPDRAVSHILSLQTGTPAYNVPSNWWLFPVEALRKQQKFAPALNVIKRGLVLNPDADELLEGKALILSEMNELGEAEAVWRRLILRMPEQHSFYNNLGYTLLEKAGRLADAEPLIRKAYELEPKDAAVLDSMGWLMFKKGQPKEARPYLEEALKAGNPQDAEILLHLAEVCVAAGDINEAKKILIQIESLKTKEWPLLKALKARLGKSVE